MKNNKETIKKVSAKVHEELLNTSHLFIDETVATLTRMQRITGKVIKKSEPILEKQIEITFDAVEALANQASKGGKRALKLFGVTKTYNKLTSTITNKVKEIPSTEEMIENAKKFAANAKSDVEERFEDVSEKIKDGKITEIFTLGEDKVVAKKAVAKTKTAKKAVKKVVAKAKTAKKTAPKKVAKAVAKKAPTAKKVAVSNVKTVKTPVAKKATVKAVKATTKAAVSELTAIKGIGPSLAAIMTDNGIKTLKDLQAATPTSLKVIAAKAGNRYKTFDTNNWVKAAKAIAK